MKLDRFNEETDRLVAESMNDDKRARRLTRLARRRRKIVAFMILYPVGVFVLFFLYMRWRGLDDDISLTIDRAGMLFMFFLLYLAAVINYRDVVSEIRLLKIVDALTLAINEPNLTTDANES